MVVMTVKIKAMLGTGEFQGRMVEEGMNSVLDGLVFYEKGTCEWGLDVRGGVSWGRVQRRETWQGDAFRNVLLRKKY